MNAPQPPISNLRLQAHGLHFAYRGHKVLTGVSLTVQSGEVVSLLGINGAGKSTLLRLLLGFLSPAQGSVELGGHPLSSFRRREIARHIAYVPQVHVPPFPYSVREIVLLGRLPHTGLAAAYGREDEAEVDHCLSRLEITHLADRPYTEISGGERQLTLIARALVQGARILVLDEPMAGLDYGNQIRLLHRLRLLAQDGYAVLKTTHHPEHALADSDRVVLLENGHITADGVPVEV
uniref:ABC transporter ATP-binding protein n=1 Tax=uncultured Thiodictyon sp. TaxID=1846217 RepID=UPI0025FAA2A9